MYVSTCQRIWISLVPQAIHLVKARFEKSSSLIRIRNFLGKKYELSMKYGMYNSHFEMWPHSLSINNWRETALFFDSLVSGLGRRLYVVKEAFILHIMCSLTSVKCGRPIYKSQTFSSLFPTISFISDQGNLFQISRSSTWRYVRKIRVL